jgi:RNA polymerase sigma-70 factor (ECF subfamily)
MKAEHIEILVLQSQEGHIPSYEHLFKHFAPLMLKYAVYKVHDPMIAEDLVQNVWIKVSKKLSQLNDVSLFRSWLFRAMRWEVIDWYRQQREFEDIDNYDLSATDDKEQDSGLLPQIAKLANDEREIVEHYYLNELSLIETALVLGIPEGTAKSRLYRARESLKAHYEKETNNDEHR